MKNEITFFSSLTEKWTYVLIQFLRYFLKIVNINSFSIWNTFLQFQDVGTELLWSVSNRGLTWLHNVLQKIVLNIANYDILFRQATNQESWAFLLPNCFESKAKLEKWYQICIGWCKKLNSWIHINMKKPYWRYPVCKKIIGWIIRM